MTLPNDSRYAASTLLPDFLGAAGGQLIGTIELEDGGAEDDVWDLLIRAESDETSARNGRATQRVWADLDRLHDDLAAELLAWRRRWLDAAG
jgi:hypothetical protein